MAYGVENQDGHAIDASEAEAAEVAVGNSSLLPDPRQLLLILWRRIWIFLFVVAAVIAAVLAYTMLTPKRYSASATVLIEPRKGDPIQARETAPADQAPTSDFIDTQILVIDSPQNASAVVRALKLTEDPEFATGVTVPQTIGQSDAERQAARVFEVGQRLRNAVTVRRAGQTALIEITATSLSAGQAARIANEYSNQYLAGIEAAKRATEQQSSAQIDSRLTQLRKDAERADSDLQRYKIAHGLMSAEGATMAEQETSSLNQQIAVARSALAERQGRLAAARRQVTQGGGGSNVASALNSGTIGALRAQEADSSRTLAQLRARYGERHPAIAQEEGRLADIRRQIQLEIDRILSSLEAEVNVAQSGLQSLLASQGQSRAQLAGNAQAQVGYMELDRKATAAKTIYEAFLARSKGTAARDGISDPIASVSAPAVEPTSPSSPNTRLAYLLGSVFAVLAGLLAVAVSEFLDGGIRTKLDVEKRLGARYLGAVPDVESTLGGLRLTESPQDYVVSHPLSTFAESLRSLRAAVTLRGNRRPKIIALTSALPREGKTTTAVSLARTLALSGASTVLVDCDLRRHSASDLLLDGRPGLLADVLGGKTDVETALLRDTATDLQILGISEAPGDGRDLLDPERVSRLLAELRARFEFVVIDTAPVLGIADARAVASQADAVILLARWRSTSLRAADSALDLLLASKAKVVGVALTQVDIRKYASTGHEDLYGYHKKFKGYYVN
ncbi:polysaccharide biosynthesis tyrosine autokinase [Sphingomonas sp. RB3P16]|uniref:GumC family protein n=1 Tax=Parasphingomonas frigoris TaxID=3096163 RepID=UPI002FC73D39